MNGIAISTASLPEAPLARQLTQAKTIGYDAVEIVAAVSKHPLINDSDELGELLAKNDLNLAAWYPPPLNPQPNTPNTNLKEVVSGGLLAHSVGCDLIVFPPLPPRETCDFSKLGNLLKEALKQLPSTTQIAIENHYPWPIMYPNDYYELFDRIDDTRLGVAFDTGHFVPTGINILDALGQLWPHIFHVHLKDQIDTRGRWLGNGKAMISEIIRELIERSYNGWITIEMELEKSEEMLPAVIAALPYVKNEFSKYR